MNKLLILKNYTGFCEADLDAQPYFLFEQYIKLINQLTEKENKDRETSEKEQAKQNSFNPSSMMKGMGNFSSMMNKFKK